MSNHTKEPWLCDKRTVYALNKNGFNIFSAVVQDCHAGNSELEANALRIVACVNACEGIETDDLNAYRVVSAKEYREIERQRDGLLAAAEKAAQVLKEYHDRFMMADHWEGGGSHKSLVYQDMKAIASVKGGALNADTGIHTEPLLIPICFNVDRSELERKLGQETMKSIDECNAITRELYNEVIRQRYKLAKQNVRLFNDLRYTCENQTFGDTYTREVDDVIASAIGGAA